MREEAIGVRRVRKNVRIKNIERSYKMKKKAKGRDWEMRENEEGVGKEEDRNKTGMGMRKVMLPKKIKQMS